MGCASSLVDRIENPLASSRKTARAKPDRASLTAEFAKFGDEIRQELDPIGPLQRLLAEYLVQVAWRLKVAIERQKIRSIDDSTDPSPENPRSSARLTTIERATRAVREALEAFEACRSLGIPRAKSAIFHEIRTEPEVESNEWPIVPEIDDENPHWRDRLTFDFEVSDVSPVVKGTWVTVGHVVSLIIDGWTWADILRAHPELSEDDIRACVTYAMDEENASR